MRTAVRTVVGAVLLALTVTACGSEAARRTAEPSRPRTSSTSSTSAAPAPVRAAAAASSAPTPVVTPCTHNRAGQLVAVSLRRQHLWMCAHHHVMYSTAITSGMTGQYTETPTGHYTIQGRNRHTTLTLNTGATYTVDYWIPFDAPLYGFHDAPWQRFAYGSPKYRTDGSHGCVHLPHRAIAFLYRWADIGTTVTITR